MANRILNISEAASLGIHACAILAANPDRPLVVGAIAAALTASEAHLSKVLQDLAKVGLVKSVRGPRGGFVLARPARVISLLNIYEAIEGPFETDTCISLHRPPFCTGEKCIFGGMVASVHRRVLKHLSRTPLSALREVFAKVKVEQSGHMDETDTRARGRRRQQPRGVAPCLGETPIRKKSMKRRA